MRFEIDDALYDTTDMTVVRLGQVTLFVTPDEQTVFVARLDGHRGMVVKRADRIEVQFYAEQTRHPALEAVAGTPVPEGAD